MVPSCLVHHKQGNSNLSKPNTEIVFALNTKKGKNHNMMTSTCFIIQTPLIVMFDTSSSHSFISPLCVLQLNLSLHELSFMLVVTTTTMNSIGTSLIFHQCSFILFNIIFFLIDLVCLPLKGLDIILGMDWLSEYSVTVVSHGKEIIIPPISPQPEQPKLSSLTNYSKLFQCLNNGDQGIPFLLSSNSGSEVELLNILVVN